MLKVIDLKEIEQRNNMDTEEELIELAISGMESLELIDTLDKNYIISKLKKDYIGTVIDVLQLQEGDEFYENYASYRGIKCNELKSKRKIYVCLFDQIDSMEDICEKEEELGQFIEILDLDNLKNKAYDIRKDYVGTIIDVLQIQEGDEFYEKYKNNIRKNLRLTDRECYGAVYIIVAKIKLALKLMELLKFCDSSNKTYIISKLKEDYVGTIIDVLQLQEGDEFYEKYKNYIGVKVSEKLEDKYFETITDKLKAIIKRIEVALKLIEPLETTDSSIISKLKEDYIGTIIDVLQIQEGDEFYEKYKNYIGIKVSEKLDELEECNNIGSDLKKLVETNENVNRTFIKPIVKLMEELGLSDLSNRNYIISNFKKDYVGTITDMLNVRSESFYAKYKNDIGKGCYRVANEYYDMNDSFIVAHRFSSTDLINLTGRIRNDKNFKIFKNYALSKEELKLLYDKNVLASQILEVAQKIKKSIEISSLFSSDISEYLRSLGVKMIFTESKEENYNGGSIICITDFHIIFLEDFVVNFVIPLKKVKELKVEKKEYTTEADEVYFKRELTSSQKVIRGAAIGGIIAGPTGAIVGAIANKENEATSTVKPVNIHRKYHYIDFELSIKMENDEPSEALKRLKQYEVTSYSMSCPQIFANKETANKKINEDLLAEKYNFNDINKELDLLVKRAKEIQDVEEMKNITQEKIEGAFDIEKKTKKDTFWFKVQVVCLISLIAFLILILSNL